MSALVQVTLLLDVSSPVWDSMAIDGTNELLRELQRSFTAGSVLIDYAIGDVQIDERPIPDNYAEGDWM